MKTLWIINFVISFVIWSTYPLLFLFYVPVIFITSFLLMVHASEKRRRERETVIQARDLSSVQPKQLGRDTSLSLPRNARRCQMTSSTALDAFVWAVRAVLVLGVLYVAGMMLEYFLEEFLL